MACLKAFASIYIALFFSLTLVSIALLSSRSSSLSSSSVAYATVLEKKHYADLALKKVFSQVLKESGGVDEKQSSGSIAENLVSLEGFAKQYYSKQGFRTQFWFGAFDPAEEEWMLEETLRKGTPVSCSHCYPLGERTLDWEKKPVRKSVEFIFDRRISKLGFSHTLSSQEWIGQNIAFGATFYWPEKRMAWVVVLKEGFGG